MADLGKNILLIEDDLPIIDVYKTAFAKASHFEVKVIISGREALKEVKKIRDGKAEKPDLVLLDLILPDINGIEALKEIRRYKETKNIPVFILTNYQSEKLEKKGREFKAEEYIIKTNCLPSRLVKLIKERLSEE